MRSILCLLLLSACSDYGLTERKDEEPVSVTTSTEGTDGTEPEVPVDDTDTEPSEDACVPTGDELCDGVDNDCDGNIDEGDALDASVWYADTDTDNFGDADNNVVACAPPLGYVADSADCNDANAAVNPGAEEVCDWIPDNNCDGLPDSGDSDGAFDANGDGDYDDEDDWQEHSGADGYTWCFQYHAQVDNDGDGYCDRGVDNNGDGDCIDSGDVIYAEDVYAPASVIDCDVMDPEVYPGHGC